MILKQQEQPSLLGRPEQCRHKPLCSTRDQFWGLYVTAGQSESAVWELLQQLLATKQCFLLRTFHLLFVLNQ